MGSEVRWIGTATLTYSDLKVVYNPGVSTAVGPIERPKAVVRWRSGGGYSHSHSECKHSSEFEHGEK